MNDKIGHPHPLSKVIREIYSVFRDIGYDVAQGPELETEFYNFDALNIPKDHPARDMQDTFWIKSKDRKVLRTHTSAV
jgi:phenylalanyl-tRNA synthetase alpha chain